jgi:hypothetical protein
MRFKLIFALIVVAWILPFLLVNRAMIAAPARVNFIFGSVDASFGLLVLGVCVPIVLAVIVYAGIWQSSVIIETRRQARELQAQRTLADNAEASRITELGTMLRGEIAGLDQRLQSAIESLRGEFHDTERSIAAILGEMDDRIKADRAGGAGL